MLVIRKEVSMGTKNERSEAAAELDSIAEEKESEAQQHDEARLEGERDEQQDLNQGMQTGTHDASDPGIPWGPSYRIKENSASANQGPNEAEKGRK